VARMPIPIQEAVRDLVADLIGRPVAVDKVSDRIADEDMGVIGVYRDDAGGLQAVVPFDRALATVLGGGLVMVPEVVVKEHLKKGELPENLVENAWEVLNIMSSLLNREGVEHVALAERPEAWDQLGDDVKALIESPVRQRWFMMTVPGYGTGQLGFVAAT
jgi:hypothetical protein